jgi:hypothetical protein
MKHNMIGNRQKRMNILESSFLIESSAKLNPSEVAPLLQPDGRLCEIEGNGPPIPNFKSLEYGTHSSFPA